jgi:hypothetical protein
VVREPFFIGMLVILGNLPSSCLKSVGHFLDLFLNFLVQLVEGVRVDQHIPDLKVGVRRNVVLGNVPERRIVAFRARTDHPVHHAGLHRGEGFGERQGGSHVPGVVRKHLKGLHGRDPQLDALVGFRISRGHGRLVQGDAAEIDRPGGQHLDVLGGVEFLNCLPQRGARGIVLLGLVPAFDHVGEIDHLKAAVRRAGRGLDGHVHGADADALLDHGVIAQRTGRINLDLELAARGLVHLLREPVQILVNGRSLGTDMGHLIRFGVRNRGEHHQDQNCQKCRAPNSPIHTQLLQFTGFNFMCSTISSRKDPAKTTRDQARTRSERLPEHIRRSAAPWQA